MDGWMMTNLTASVFVMRPVLLPLPSCHAVIITKHTRPKSQRHNNNDQDVTSYKIQLDVFNARPDDDIMPRCWLPHQKHFDSLDPSHAHCIFSRNWQSFLHFYYRHIRY
jgi:hypothetical protein